MSNSYSQDIFDLSDEEMLALLDINDEDLVVLKLKYGKSYRQEIGTLEQFSRAIAKKLGYKDK